MCSFYTRSVKMSFRIKICYSETAIEKAIICHFREDIFYLSQVFHMK